VVSVAVGVSCVIVIVLAWTVFGRVIRDFVHECLRSLSLIRRRVARMYTPHHCELAQSLQVTINNVRFADSDDGGECRGFIHALVTNHSASAIERLCSNVRVDSDLCGSFHTAREYSDVKLGVGESAVLEMDIGLLSREMMRDGYEVHVQVVGAHTVSHEMPTYVLPESCGRALVINEGFSIATDVLVERVEISVRKGLLRSAGEVSVAYLVRNHGQAFHQGISLTTRLMSNSGEGRARSLERFDIIPWGERKVVVRFPLDQVSGISAARLAAVFTGLEDFVVGSSYYSQLSHPNEDGSEAVEEWHGEELNPTPWDGRR
jgi:hypothetical protein